MWMPLPHTAIRADGARCAELLSPSTDNSLRLEQAIFWPRFDTFTMPIITKSLELERKDMRPWKELVHNISAAPIEEAESKIRRS